MSCLICGQVAPFKIQYRDGEHVVAGICFPCVKKATAADPTKDLLAALDALVAQVERDRPIQHVADWMWLDELKAILRQHREER